MILEIRGVNMRYLIFNLFCFFMLQNNAEIISTGDPFEYIHSHIPYINNYDEFINIINQDTTFIIIISYQNNNFGVNLYTFTLMAKRYEQLYRQFANSKHIKFYRTHMTNNVHTSLYGYKNPSFQIYYKGKKIGALEGIVTKQELASFIQKNTYRSSFVICQCESYEKNYQENDDSGNMIVF